MDIIIPYQELSGNYNNETKVDIEENIIPYQELSGNYNAVARSIKEAFDYTIPRTIRELQRP